MAFFKVIEGKLLNLRPVVTELGDGRHELRRGGNMLPITVEGDQVRLHLGEYVGNPNDIEFCLIDGDELSPLGKTVLEQLVEFTLRPKNTRSPILTIDDRFNKDNASRWGNVALYKKRGKRF